MKTKNSNLSPDEQLRAENADLRARLEEAEETLRAIRSGEVDSLVVQTRQGLQIFSLEAAEAVSNRFRGEILSQVSDVVGAIDNDERITYLNSAGERLYRVQPGEMLGRKISELYERRWLKPEDEAIAMATLREHGEANWELIHITRDGRELHVQSSVCQMRDAMGNVVGIIAAIRDVSESRAVEEKLRASEAEFRATFELSAVGKAQVDARTGHFIRVNAKFCELTGYSSEELSHMRPADLDVAEDRDADTTTISQLLRGEVALYEAEKRYVRKDGKVIWVQVHATMLRDANGRPDRSMAIIQDITARKQAEADLSESEERLRRVLGQSPAGIVEADATGRMTLVNSRWCEMLGYTEGELLQMTVSDITDEGSRATTQEAVGRMAAGGPEFQIEKNYRRKDGSTFVAHTSVSAIRTQDGNFLGLVAVVMDITERKKAEDSLRESQLFTRRVLDNLFAFVGVLTPDGTLIEANRAPLEAAGISANEVVGKKFWDCPWWSYSPEVQSRLSAACESAAEGEVVRYDVPVRIAGGAMLWIDFQLAPLRDTQGRITHLIPSGMDITERMQSSQILRQNAELFVRLVDQAPTGMYVVDADFRVQQVNALAAPVFANVDPLIGRDFAEAMEVLWGREVATEVARIFHHTLDSGERYVSPSFTEQREDISDVQSYEWEIQRVLLADGRYGVACYFEDVTERLRVERAIRDSETRLRLATEANAVGIWEWNVLTGAIRWDAQMFRLYGIAPTADGLVQYSDWSRAVFPEDLAENERILQNTVRCGGKSRREFRILRGDNREQRYIEAVETVRTNDKGETEWVVGTNLDVTERKRAESALVESQRKLQLGIDVAAFALAEVDYASQTIEFSSDAARLFGLGDTATTVPRQQIHALFHPDDRGRIHAAIDACLTSEGPEQMTIEHRIVLPDGTTRWLDIRKRVHFDNSASPPKPIRSTLVARDITDEKESVERIRQGEERLRLAMNAAQLSLWEWDVVNDQILWATELYDRQSMDRMTPVGGFENFIHLVHVDDRKGVRTAIHECLSEGKAYHCEFRMQRADGTYRWVLSMAHLSIDGNNAPVRMVGVEMDITDRKENEVSIRISAERLAVAADAAGFGTLHVDLKSQTVTYSSEMKRIIGWYDDQTPSLKPEDMIKFVHPDDRDRCFKHYEKAMLTNSPKSQSIDHRIVRTDGTTRWVRLQTKTLFSDQTGEAAQIIGTVLDISQQRIFEEQLKAARDAAEAANQSKSAFVANMSHEIRTPMTAILGYADLIRDMIENPEAISHLQTIRRNGAYLLEIINDILDLSKIEAGKMDIEMERFQPVRLIEDVRSVMEVRASEGGLTLKVEYDGKLPQVIESDAKRLKQVLINLVGNAIKFTHNGTVKIRVHYEGNVDQGVLTTKNSNNQGHLRFDIIDTGIGMTDLQQERLFKPFSQGDASVTRNFGGTGLGLAISQRLAEMLGGEISVTSVEGVGSTFSVTVSTGSLMDIELVDYATQLPNQPKEVAATISEAISLDCNVLIVDDRRDIRFLSRHFLSKAGATVDEAEDGQLALDFVRTRLVEGNPPALILLDMQMPNLDGYETAKQLRESGFIGPIIALTADAMQGDMSRCLKAGCNDYLSKPIDSRRLIELVRDMTASA
jgi:PAS domain S-box-containing protein